MRTAGSKDRFAKWTRPIVALMVLAAAGSAGWAQVPSTNPAARSEAEGDAALAARLSTAAQSALRQKVVPLPVFRQAAALLEAAAQLDPTDSRYLRLRVEALLEARDTDAATAALLDYLNAEPDDQVAQTRLMDIYANQMETAESKLAYYKNKLGVSQLPQEVRSYAGVQAARLLLDRGESTAAENVLAEAIRLFPLNPAALKLRAQIMAPTQTVYERASSILALVRSNPSQPELLSELAGIAANAGLFEQSNQWYSAAIGLYPRVAQQVPMQLVRKYAAGLFVGDDAASASQLVDQLIKADSSDVENWWLALVVQKTSLKKEDTTKALKPASIAMANRVALACKAAGDTKATTRPVDSADDYTLPDIMAAAKKLSAPTESPESLANRDALVSALSDLAWYEIYFANQPNDATKLIDALAVLLPADSVTLARLRGWSFLQSGKADEANVKLSAVADRDPLAELGVIRLMASTTTGDVPKAKQDAASRGRKLISENPSGLLGAILWDGLRDLRVKIVPSNASDALKVQLDAFPKDWLHLIDQPSTFYALRAEPVRIACGYRDPLLAKVSIQNLTDYDLTLGADGVIRPDLWFNAQVRGAIEANVPAVAYDHLTGPLVLHGRQSITQIVRIDQGELENALTTNPTVAISVNAFVMVNPTSTPNGIMPGPSGYEAKFAKLFNREATPINSDQMKQRIYAAMQSGSPGQKISAMDVICTYAQLFRGAKDSTEQLKLVALEFSDVLRKMQADPVPAVSAWASYDYITVAKDDDRLATVQQLVEDPQWRKRLIGLLATGALPAAAQRELAVKAKAAGDEPWMQNLANARIDLLDLAASSTTQPAK